ncbi:glycosyltransferase family 4 protein [Enterococcus avium]|uniref:glycosyltransferase family 4 protein n=1 Tax=Enterococcus avium TaxID=33945 RepID=UPI00288CE8E6|nr:glycosyltransferase family 4 protein [Enterococcus avium]MDT2459459.1 glycosyltransferase family 4 protein [Enterococcus avium]
MKKVLMVATYGDFFAAFETRNIMILNNMGCEVHLCANWTDPNYNYKHEKLKGLEFKKVDIEFERSPFSIKNTRSYRQLSKLIKEEKYWLVDCHNAVIGVYARIAAKKNKVPKIMYTVHGFQFYSSGPKRDWIIYYPIEKWLSRYTDALLVMNLEDQAISEKFHARNNYFIHGVGIDVEKFCSVDKQYKKNKKDLGIPEHSLVLLSVGELSERKNHKTVIEALSKVNDPSIYYLIAGEGEERKKLSELIKKLDLSSNIKLLGYRSDIDDLNKIADVAIFPSLREGLMIAGLESLASSTPIIASNRKGLSDYTIDGITGYRIDPNSVYDIADKIRKFRESPEILVNMEKNTVNKAKEYSIEVVENEMEKIYFDLLS